MTRIISVSNHTNLKVARASVYTKLDSDSRPAALKALDRLKSRTK